MLEVHAILQRQRCNENITKKTGTLSDAYQTLENEKNVDLHSFCLEAYFITIINVADSSKGYIGAFKDNCLEALRGYTKVWDNAHVTVMTYEQARRKLPFVV